MKKYILTFILSFMFILNVSAYTIPSLSPTENNFYYYYNDPIETIGTQVKVYDNTTKGLILDALEEYIPSTGYYIILQSHYGDNNTGSPNYLSYNTVFTILHSTTPFVIISQRNNTGSNYPYISIKNSDLNDFDFLGNYYWKDSTSSIVSNDFYPSSTNIYDLARGDLELTTMILSSNQSTLELKDYYWYYTYDNFPLNKCNMETGTCDPIVYNTGDFIPTSLFYGNSWDPPAPVETTEKLYFSDMTESIALYLKDIEGLNPTTEYFKDIITNGYFQVFTLDWGLLSGLDLETINQIDVDSYLNESFGGIKILNNRKNIYGSPQFNEPIETKFWFNINYMNFPFFRKKLMTGDNNFEGVSSQYYIEIPKDTFGFIRFDKDNKIMYTDNGDTTISFTDISGNTVSQDLSDYNDVVILYNDPIGIKNIFSSFVDSLNHFRSSMLYVFSLFSYSFDVVPLVVRQFIIASFGLGVLIYVIKLIL